MTAKAKKGTAESSILYELEEVIKERRKLPPAQSYVAEMIKGSEQDLYRKVPEEATEVLMAAMAGGDLVEEIADLWFHSLLVMAKNGITVKEVEKTLKARRKKS